MEQSETREEKKVGGGREKGIEKVLRKVWRYMEISGWSGYEIQLWCWYCSNLIYCTGWKEYRKKRAKTVRLAGRQKMGESEEGNIEPGGEARKGEPLNSCKWLLTRNQKRVKSNDPYHLYARPRDNDVFLLVSICLSGCQDVSLCILSDYCVFRINGVYIYVFFFMAFNRKSDTHAGRPGPSRYASPEW